MSAEEKLQEAIKIATEMGKRSSQLQEAIKIANEMDKRSSQLAIKLALQVGGMVDEMRELKARSNKVLGYLDAAVFANGDISGIRIVSLSRHDYLIVRKLLGESWHDVE